MNGWHELDRRCTALNRAGERCARAPIPGGTTCVLHGGAAPQARDAAKRRLLAMVEPVLGTFEEILAIWHSTRCDKCGKPTGDPVPVIRVGQLVLDRAGFHPTLAVEQVAPPNPFANFSDDELVDKLELLLAAAKARRDEHQRLALPTAVDADVFVVEDGPEEALGLAAPAAVAPEPGRSEADSGAVRHMHVPNGGDPPDAGMVRSPWGHNQGPRK